SGRGRKDSLTPCQSVTPVVLAHWLPRVRPGTHRQGKLWPPTAATSIARLTGAGQHVSIKIDKRADQVCSSTTSSGFLSSRHPKNVVWRSCSSAVISAKATSQTSFGSTH